MTVPAPGCYHYSLEWSQTTGPAYVAFSAEGPAPYATPTLVGDGAIAVYQGGEPPASCKVTAIRRAPNSTNGATDEMDVTVTDPDGIGGIYDVQATNATVAAVPDGWVPGITGRLTVRATKTSSRAQARWSFTVADMNGVEKACT